MAKKTTETKSKRRTIVSDTGKVEAKLTPQQARKVKGGAETTRRPPGGNDSIWLDLAAPVMTGRKK